MEDTPEKETQETEQAKSPERRKLLKLLAAGGVVTAASMVPGKWSSPVVKSGVLPAHAQVTPTPTPSPEYTVTCDPEWDIGEGEIGPVYYFSAVAIEITTNQPVANVMLTATISGNQSDYTEQVQTDAQGRSFFQIEVNGNDVTPPVSATVRFSDQGTYGSDDCTIPFDLPA